MNRFKLFIDNFIIYGLGGVIGKMIPFFMLPVITRMLPNTYYMGLNDITNTVLSFAQALAVMGMYDAMFRMFFDQDGMEYRQEICSGALAVTFITSAVIFTAMFALKKNLAVQFFGKEEFDTLIILTSMGVLSGATNSIVSAPTRMENKRKTYLFTNIFTPFASYCIAIALLTRGEYIYAFPVGNLIAAFMTELIFIGLNRKWFSIRKVRFKHIRALMMIGIPLLPNFLIYWVFNSCDRIMISKILGMEYTGIYAVGAKFGQLSQLIYIGFSGGWQYFAFSTMHDKDQVDMTSRIFEYLGCLSVCATVVISVCTEVFFGVLFGDAYSAASVTVPYLFMAPLAQMLFQVASSQFLVVKKTWPSSLILFCGAACNIILNALLIPLLGIEGASLSTLFGFVFSTALSVVVLQKMGLFKIPKRFIGICAVSIIYFILCRIFMKGNIGYKIISGTLFIAGCALLYKKELNELKKMISGTLKKGI